MKKHYEKFKIKKLVDDQNIKEEVMNQKMLLKMKKNINILKKEQENEYK